MTAEEFKMIRSLKWAPIDINGEMFATILDQTEVHLFWLDFMKYVFAPKFQKQQAITTINNFNLTQPVYINEKLKLLLPNDLESVFYYANNQTLPFKFSINVSQGLIFIISIIILLLFMCYDIILKPESKILFI